MADATGPSRQFTARAQEAARAAALIATAIGSPADALAPRPAMPAASADAASAEPAPGAAARVADPAEPPMLVPAIRAALSADSAVEAPGAASCASCASAAADPSSDLHPRVMSPATGEGAALETASRSTGHQTTDPSDGVASTGQPPSVGASCGKPNGCVCSVSI